jgi:hypothetical protein
VFILISVSFTESFDEPGLNGFSGFTGYEFIFCNHVKELVADASQRGLGCGIMQVTKVNCLLW